MSAGKYIGYAVEVDSVESSRHILDDPLVQLEIDMMITTSLAEHLSTGSTR